MLRLQVDLLKNILLADNAQKEYRDRKEQYRKAVNVLSKGGAPLDQIKEAQDQFKDMQDGESSAQWLRDRLRFIGDGLAWRLLNYDRSVLRLLAEHPPVSVPQLDAGLATEIEELIRLAEEESRPVLLNAITNFLRIGDITVYDPDSGDIRLVEVKSGRKANSRTLRQSEYRSQIQMALRSGVSEMGGEKIRSIIAERPLKTYVHSIEHAMEESSERLSASRKFGDYLTVAVWPVNKVNECVTEEAWPEIWNATVERLYSVQKSSSDVLLVLQPHLCRSLSLPS